MSKCLHNLSLGTCHLYIYVSLKWKIKFERKKNTRWDFTFLSIKQRKQIVNFSYYIWFQFYTYNISYSTREKFINLSWVGIQWNLVLYSKGSLCCNIWMHRFFFNILNNERYHLRVLKSQNIYLEGIHARFKLLLLTNIFTYMPSFFFSNAIIMHILYMHAFSPYHFTSNCFNSYISCKLHSPSYKKKYAINILDFLTED